MKLLSLHCDYIKFKPVKKALKEPEELSEKRKQLTEIKNPLVILTAVEKQDESNSNILQQYIKEIEGIAKQVDAKNIVLYPYAHLSPSLSSPQFALKTLENAEIELSKTKKYNITRAPFGYYKEFELKCKGHPLAELSREINSKGEVKDIEEEVNQEELIKKLSKVKMSAEKGKGGLKSNVELGRELDLYLVSEIVGSGLPLFTPKGTTIRREIERFIVDEEIKRGYQYTSTPVMAKSDLYKVSGHWQHYKDLMFSFKVGDEVFALRPMTCPFQFIIYKSKPRSYKELPVKYAEISSLFRNEKSGELMGLTRLRQFTLADAHIICKPEQLEEEFAKVLDLVQHVMKTLKIEDIWYRFSKWDSKNKEKYIDNPKAWDDSQKIMKKILDKLKVKYVESENEAAFYGPKLDLQYKNVFEKEDTLITIQIDFALPERYDLTYTDENNKTKSPMIIHRSSVGCLERTIAYILEKTQGHLPLWLSPIQVRVINFTDRNNKSCEKLKQELEEKGFRVDIDLTSEPIGGKIKQAEIEKIPYAITIGDREEKAGTLAVRHKSKVTQVKKDDFIKQIIKEKEERK
jgi:threonyl-tRNA synthetase